MPPSLATVGSPALLFVLKIGRGHDARLGSKSCDEEGRLKFQFQSFASFGKASRYVFFHIMFAGISTCFVFDGRCDQYRNHAAIILVKIRK